MLGIRFRRNTFSRAEFAQQLATITDQMSADSQRAVTNAIGSATRAIMAKLAIMEKKMAKLDELLDAVAAQQTKIDSLITLTNGLHDQVIAAMGDTITPSQKMRIDQVFSAVEENSTDIDAAITANTPEATAGAVSGGPSMSDIKSGNVDPGPAIGSTDPVPPATN